MRFEELVAQRLAAVLRFAAVLTGDRASAEDVVQEVLIRVHQHWDTISRLDQPEIYIRKMIVNEFVSSRRKLWRLVPSGRGSEVDHRVTSDHAASHAERDALLSELAKLPRRQRAVLVLRYYEQLPDTAIAEILGCAPGTVRSCASRAMATLRIEMSGPLSAPALPARALPARALPARALPARALPARALPAPPLAQRPGAGPPPSCAFPEESKS